MAGSVQIIVDKRSIQTFRHKLDMLANVVSDDMVNAAIEFGEEVLAASNALIPVDTGTAAQAAGIKQEPARSGARVRVGYAVTKDPVNPRSGELASSYLTTLHEDLSTPHENGQAKFFETAIMQHSYEFYSKGRMRMAGKLGGSVVNLGPSSPPKHIDYLAPALNRVSAGYTTTHNGGAYMPYLGNKGQ